MENYLQRDDRIFIAGATGMAGSAIVRKLKEKGYGNQKYNGKLLTPTRKELDLKDLNSVKNWFKENNPTIVILAAAKVGGILANEQMPASFLIDNLKIQTNIIETAWTYGVKRLLFLSSSCIYPKYSEQPIKEEYLLKGALEPTNEWYAIAKIAGIKLCQSLRIQYGFDAISLMSTSLYGPGDNYHPTESHVIPSLINKFYTAFKNNSRSVTCWGTGSPLREFMHVDDLGEATIYALEKWNPASTNAPLDDNGKPLTYLNVGTGIDISIKELSKTIAKYIDFNGEIIWDASKPDGTPKKQLDIRRFKDLGWSAKIDFEKGIKDTVHTYINENK